LPKRAGSNNGGAPINNTFPGLEKAPFHAGQYQFQITHQGALAAIAWY
jgi:hypothetical protein